MCSEIGGEMPSKIYNRVCQVTTARWKRFSSYPTSIPDFCRHIHFKKSFEWGLEENMTLF